MSLNFPYFKKIKFSDKLIINHLTKEFPPYSDFTFTSLWTYNTENNVEFSILNDNLVVKFQDYIDKKPFYSFIGKNKIEDTVNKITSFSHKKGLSKYLKLIPEVVVKSEPKLKNKYHITEDIDNHDYIISAKELAFLDRVRYKKKRYLVGRFKKKHPSHSVIKLDLTDKQVVKQMISLFNLWEQVNNLEKKHTEVEKIAFIRMLSKAKELNVQGTGIYIENKLAAFTTYEVVHNKYAIALFEKADRRFTDIYSALNHHGAIHLYELGCTYINFEQDLGKEGLRKAKKLWKPTHFLKKYILKPHN